MDLILEPLLAVRDLLGAGGYVLWFILILTIVLWSLLCERLIFFWKVFPFQIKAIESQWQTMAQHSEWAQRKIKQATISEVKLTLNSTIPLIKTIVAVCPMFGLLGTVTGMIEVFDVMAVMGTGNARSMASGISKATIPTMAGMVVALSGLYLISRIESYAEVQAQKLSDHLPCSGGSAL